MILGVSDFTPFPKDRLFFAQALCQKVWGCFDWVLPPKNSTRTLVTFGNFSRCKLISGPGVPHSGGVSMMMVHISRKDVGKLKLSIDAEMELSLFFISAVREQER